VARVRRVSERAVAVEGQQAVAGAGTGNGRGGQRVLVRVGVVGENAELCRDGQQHIGVDAVRVVRGAGGGVGDRDGDRRRGAVQGAVVDAVRKGVRADVV